jgi:hypothetical protein
MHIHPLGKRIVSLVLAGSVTLTGCVSTTTLQTNPSGAKVYLNDEPVGKTPYIHRDTRIVGSTTTVRLEKEGYNPIHTTLTRDEEVDVGAIIGGLILFFPFIWTLKYKPMHNYELVPAAPAQPIQVPHPATAPVKTKFERLRELKQLLDDKIITQEEFSREKKKILDEDEK